VTVSSIGVSVICSRFDDGVQTPRRYRSGVPNRNYRTAANLP
jgi:hypothetical protein